MSNKRRMRLAMCCSLVFTTAAHAGEPNPNQQFQAAEAQFQAGQFAPAAAQLEALLTQLPNSFEVHELLGLVYAAQSLPAKATRQLDLAVRLQPESAPARTNLAAALVRAGEPALALPQFRKALALEPQSFEANHNLGEFYIQTGKIGDAMPLLEQAQRIDPSHYDNGYDLALAYCLTGQLGRSRELVQALMAQKDTGELHNLLGQLDEKSGNYLAAAKDFETAAHLDPDEQNLFDWGSEFLLHRTYEPAIAVFQQGAKLYPQSPRLWMGLGMALSARGKYDEAITALLQAIDLAPRDPRGYRFLAHAYDVSAGPSDAVVERFRRYAELEPRAPLAPYYYAMSLIKSNRPQPGSPAFQQVETLLKRSLALDEKLADTHLQLGNLYSDQHEDSAAFSQYVRALQLDPGLTDAHYRLGQYYVHAGRKDLAQHEMETYQQLHAKYLADLDKEGNAVQQFVLAAKASPGNKPSNE